MDSKHIVPLSNSETSSFCSQMAVILKSGISSIEGITMMLEESDQPDEKELLTQIQNRLMETGIFYESLDETGVFPAYMVQMVQIGEQTGKLDDVMDSLAGYYEKESSLAQTIKNAIAYPMIMLAMMLLVILVLITKVMPVFDQVFQQLGASMTGFPRAVLMLGTFLNRHAILVLCFLAVIACVVFYLVKSTKGQKLFYRFLNNFKKTRILSERIAAYRFSNGMALTLSSGLPPEECLNLTTKLIDQKTFQNRLSDCLASVSEGEDLCDSLLKHEVFTGLYARMASIGYRTGAMDEVMQKIAAGYEEDVDARLNGMIAAIEPTLVIILSVIVGIILLSVMLPLIGILSGL